MKKKRLIRGREWPGLKKLLVIMKLTTFFLFLSVMAIASGSYSQNTRFDLTIRDASIVDVLEEIEQQTEYGFLFKTDQLDLNQRYTLDLKSAKIETVMDQVLDKNLYSYQIMDRIIVISKLDANQLPVKDQNQKKISGKVLDTEGLPLPGVTVLVKGSNNGTVTNIDGEYLLNNIPADAVLQFSFVGMRTQEVVVENRTTIDVTMETDAIGIDEVVAIGYGVSKKNDLTGSLSSVSVDDISRQPIINVGESLRGKATGVQITQQNAAPGAGIRMRIRGANSVNGSNDPLYVIDGFVGGDFNSLNANDIESISILKDASATSLYGSRGSNGVVLVTTKQAKAGDSKIEYNAFLSFDQASKTLDVLNATEFMTVANERQAAIEASDFFTSSEIAAAGEGVDWQDEILRTSLSQNHQLSFTGSKADTRYYLSGTYQDQQGIVLNSFYKKYGFRSNINSNLRKNFNVSSNIYGIYSHARNNSTYDGRNSPLGASLIFPACVDIKDENGEYNISPTGYGPVAGNPVYMTYEGTKGGKNSYTINILGDLKFDWTIMDGLKLMVSGGVNLIASKYTSQTVPTKDSDASTAECLQSDNMVVNYQNTNQLSYSKSINDHKIDATLVYEQQKYVNKSLYGEGTGFSTLALGVNALELASSQAVSSGYTEWSLQSFLGRANYSYKNKYMATASMRVDGSSKFSDGNKYGYFPSGALAWRISEEEFIKSTGLFHNLKLRGSYGVVGSQAISPYSTLQQLAFGTSQGNNYQFDNVTSTISIAPSSPANTNLKWESTAQLDAGLDFGILDGRLSGTIDYYYKKTTDLLMRVTIPAYLYGGSQLQNVGSMENKGFEFALTGVLLNTRDWNITTSANISFNRNKILELGEDDEDVFVSTSAGWTTYSSYCILQKDKPLGQMYGLTYLGTWKSSEATEAANYGNVPGDAKYLDVNGDYTIDGEDMDVIGQGLPDFTWSWNLSLSYKNFDLNVLVNGVQGNDVWNFTRFLYEGQNSSVKIPTSTAILNRWSTSNEGSDIPTFSSSNVDEQQSSRWIEDGSYMRLSNVTLGYTFDNVLKNTFFREAKVYVSGQNLYTITGYSGYNPEASVTGSYQDSAIGYDFAGYPALRSYIIGVKFSF